MRCSIHSWCIYSSFMSGEAETLTQLPPYQERYSVYGRCLEPCSAAALNQTPLCTEIYIKYPLPTICL